MASNKGINKVAKIIAERDEIDLEEAQEIVEDAVDEVNYILETGGSYSDVEDILYSDLGLEMDYLIYLL